MPETQKKQIRNPEVRRLVKLASDPNTPEDIKNSARSSLSAMARAGARVRRAAQAYKRASRGW